MIITLICGGSGSENIQRGLYEINKNININIIINGYDDGKSTGVLRKLFPHTLGISDFRKNQLLEYKLLYGNNDTYKILNNRFTSNDPCNYILELINTLNIEDNIKFFLINNTKYFFNLEQSKTIKYEDFNYMNIIYCSLLHKNNFNMITVCNIIKKELMLRNNIYINSHDNLILQGITQNNKVLSDEASIVDFNDVNDKIIDVKFNNNNFPILDKDTESLLLHSDLIIFSCGTQFSSLIPTYKTILFNDTLKKCKALKYLILNCDYDNDIINYTGNELLDKINEYISLQKDDFKIIISDDMNEKLFPTKDCYNYINIPKLITKNRHNGYIIWKYILKDYFDKYYNKKYIFDYDYTLYDEKYINVSSDNLFCLNKIDNKIIVSNNCISNISASIKDCVVYSNIGNIKNYNDKFEYVNEKYLLNKTDIQFLNDIIQKINKVNNFEINNRKNVSISIKNIVSDRDEIIKDINKYISNTDYEIIKTGKTTIEFVKKGLCKRELFINNKFFDGDYTYITDMNDINYNNSVDNIKYLHVDNINITNLFLKSLIINRKYDFCIIAGGINKRMNINYPKCLIEIDNKIVLVNILEKIKPYANNIYVCCNNYYKEYFLHYEENIKEDNIKFVYLNSIDNSQFFPKGNGETLYQILQNYNLTDKVFVMWSDIILNNNKIFEEMYNLQYDNDFLIPTVYEDNPYAYLIFENNRIKKFGYRKDNPIKKGYHDQSIFLVNTAIVKDKLNLIINNKYDEINFLDIVEYIDKVSFFDTKYPLKSFNSFDEIKII